MLTKKRLNYIFIIKKKKNRNLIATQNAKLPFFIQFILVHTKNCTNMNKDARKTSFAIQ